MKNQSHCPYLLNHLMMSYKGGAGYCRPHLSEFSTAYKEFSWDLFFHKRDVHQSDLAAGRLGFCKGCTYLEEGIGVKPKYKFSFLDLSFTSFCNLRCIYCYIPVSDLGKRDVSIEKERLEILKEILSNKMLDPEGGISFSGGEPTITSVFDEACSLLRNYSPNLSYTFVTNGTHISSEVIELMKSDSWVSFMISLDAHDNKLYTKIKGKNLFHKVVENLKQYLAIAEQYPNNQINVKFILMKENIESISDFLDMVAALGFKEVYYDIITKSTHDKEMQIILIPSAIEFYFEAKKRGIEAIAESTGLSLQSLKDKIQKGINHRPYFLLLKIKRVLFVIAKQLVHLVKNKSRK